MKEGKRKGKGGIEASGIEPEKALSKYQHILKVCAGTYSYLFKSSMTPIEEEKIHPISFSSSIGVFSSIENSL